MVDWLLRHGFVLIMAGFFLFFALTAKSFLTPGNLLDVLEGNAVLLILALAMTLIVAAGGIDLSVGVALDFGAAFAMVALKQYGAPGAVAVMAAILGGALVGLANAGLIVGLGVSPFLATLSVLFIGSSVERIYTEGGGPIAFRAMPASYRDLAAGNVLGVPTEIVHRARGPGRLLCRAGVVDPRQAHPCHRPAAPGRRGRRDPHRPLSGGDVRGRFGDLRPRWGDPLGQLCASSRRSRARPTSCMRSPRCSSAHRCTRTRGRTCRARCWACCSSAWSPTASTCMGLDFNVKDALAGLILVCALALSDRPATAAAMIADPSWP